MTRILAFGGSGLLGSDLVPALRARGHEVLAPGSGTVDITHAGAVENTIHGFAPDWVVNLAAFTDVNGSEARPAEAFRLNRDAAGRAAGAAAAFGARFLQVSTDYVFDGTARRPYPPEAPLSPLGTYGRSKAEGEEHVLGAGGRPLIVRTSWLYGTGGPNFVDTILRRARAGERLRVVDDQRGRPTWTGSLAETLCDLIAGGAEGILHAADDGEASWFDLAQASLRLAGVENELEPVRTADRFGTARRPAYSVLELSATTALLGRSFPHWTESLARYLSAPPPSVP